MRFLGSLLSSLAEAHVRCLDLSAFSESPVAITAITADDMCQFIKVGHQSIIDLLAAIPLMVIIF